MSQYINNIKRQLKHGAQKHRDTVKVLCWYIFYIKRYIGSPAINLINVIRVTNIGIGNIEGLFCGD